MNKMIELIKDHRSIRKFNNQPITESEEETILDCALRAASAGNMMQYSIISVRDKTTLSKLADSCDSQPFIGDASLALLFVADNHKWEKFFESRNVTDNGKPYGGPEVPDMFLAMQDGIIAAQNSVLAAESLGIGTCYIGDIMEHAEFHCDLFNFPKHVMPLTLVVMGHYDHTPVLRDRFNKEHMVFSETYPNIDEKFVTDMFSKKEESKSDFAQKFYSRKIEAAFFKEMIRSIKVYLEQWL